MEFTGRGRRSKVIQLLHKWFSNPWVLTMDVGGDCCCESHGKYYRNKETGRRKFVPRYPSEHGGQAEIMLPDEKAIWIKR